MALVSLLFTWAYSGGWNVLGVKKLIWVAISLEYQLRRKDFFSLFSLKLTASLQDAVVIRITCTCFVVPLSGTFTSILAGGICHCGILCQSALFNNSVRMSVYRFSGLQGRCCSSDSSLASYTVYDNKLVQTFRRTCRVQMASKWLVGINVSFVYKSSKDLAFIADRPLTLQPS